MPLVRFIFKTNWIIKEKPSANLLGKANSAVTGPHSKYENNKIVCLWNLKDALSQTDLLHDYQHKPVPPAHTVYASCGEN